MSGEYAYGYLSTTDSTKTTSSGLGIDTAIVKFGVSEDLGGGSRVDVKMAVNLGEYHSQYVAGGATADDSSITLTTPMFSLSLLNYKPGDWVTGASGGATWYGLDGRVLLDRATRDAIAVTIPVSPAVNVTVAYLEPGDRTGEGAGTDGNTKQTLYSFGATYASGPLSLSGAYLSYNNVGATDASTSNVTRLGGKYNLGFANVGAGLQTAKTAAGGVITQTALSASAPLTGNVSVNGTYGTTTATQTGATAGLNGTRNGYMLGLQYNLSKRTYAILNTGSWTGASTAPAATATFTNDTATSSLTALTLVHDF